ncbi:MAG: FlgD immunoglobulin-like domain containing protein, partial [Candidatus Marinimicrobia bacterium]|nr:FlgD immunoglobulin-like domain containing protein [Candidatus Neomarinimicrobiota bacterium]
DVKITIYDLRGRAIKTLNEGLKDSGQHIFVWDGKNDEDKKVSSGIYFYQLKSKQYNKARKMIFINN